MNNTMSLYAQALSANREYANARINAVTVGSVIDANNWKAYLEACLLPAYAVRKYQYDHMLGEELTEVPKSIKDEAYKHISELMKIIGDVHGDTINPDNVIGEFVANSLRYRKIDTSIEMASARRIEADARKKKDDDEEAQAYYTKCHAEVVRLEGIAGNCKRVPDVNTYGDFACKIERALGDAINHQCARPIDEIMAERANREARRRERRRANKNAKKAAK